MAIATSPTEFKDVAQSRRPDLSKGIVQPVSPGTDWLTLVEAGGCDGTDTLTTPQTAGTSRPVARISGVGTLLALRLRYDDGDTPSTDPIIEVAGRSRANGGTYSNNWQKLYTVEDTPAKTSTLTTASSTDVTDGTDKFTDVNPKSNVFDCQGVDEVVVLISTAYAVSAGDASLATIEGRLF